MRSIKLHHTHAASCCSCCVWIFLGHVGHEGLGGEDHAGDGNGVLESASRYLGWVEDTSVDHVFVDILAGVVAFANWQGLDVFADDAAFYAGVFSDLAHWRFEGFLDDVDTCLCVCFAHVDGFKGWQNVEEGGAAAGDDAFFNCSLGCREGVFDAMFLFGELGLGGCANLENGYAAQASLARRSDIFRGRNRWWFLR